VCASLKNVAETCLTPVVLVSALQERESRLEGLEAGADDFLSKPVDPQELYARVRSLIRLKRLTADLESAESLFLTLGRFIEARDPYTEDHCDRLAQYAMALGTSMGLSRDDLDLESAESLFLTLGRFIEARDPYTEDHCDRLAQYAMALGTSMGLSRDDL